MNTVGAIVLRKISTMHAYRTEKTPPYYAAIFMAELNDVDRDGYLETGECLLKLAQQQSGFLGYEDLCLGGNHSFNVSYWSDTGSVKAWQKHTKHLAAQRLGKERW